MAAATAARKSGAGSASAGKSTEKKDSKIKTAAKNAGHKVKKVAQDAGDKVKKAANDVKKATERYIAALEEAHRRGFNDGYSAADKLPERRGARHAATVGYNGGIKTRQKEKKLAAKKAKNTAGGKKSNR